MKKNLKYFSQGTGLIEHYIFIKILARILDYFKNISPNTITLISFILVLVSFFLIINGYIFIGLLIYIIFPLLDLLDGAIARKFNKKSTLGAVFDGFTDTISEILILIALGIYFNQEILFLYLSVFILIIQVFSLRTKWILDEKERQIDFRNEKNAIKLIIILLTRNDTRKMLLFILGILGKYTLILSYFMLIYILNFIYTLIKIVKIGKK